MIRREMYMERISPFIGQDVVKVLTGMRRSGKSVMLGLIQDELRAKGIPESRVIGFNFESFSNSRFCTAQSLYDELARRVKGIEGKVYLFFDEIQEVTDWEKCINSARVDFDCDIYITGSNAKLLSGELATLLGGRYVEFVIYPFSFAEFVESRAQAGSLENNTALFRDYLETGGMPFLSHLNSDRITAEQYLRDVYNSVILKDVVRRNNIRDVDLLERIISYVMANVGHTFSARSISSYFKSENRKASPETILNYIRACCDACLFYQVRRKDVISKAILSINEKYYIVDHGMRQAVFGGNVHDMDQVLENVVCMELVRRGWHVSVGKAGEKEIDFIAEKNGEKIYIQTAYLLPSAETIEREFGIYKEIRDHYPKYVLSMDEFDLSRDGIRHWNIRDFLLASEWN